MSRNLQFGLLGNLGAVFVDVQLWFGLSCEEQQDCESVKLDLIANNNRKH